MAEAEELQSGGRQGAPGPVVLAINICDTVLREEGTNKVSLIGLFGIIWARKFPCRHQRMYVHVALTDVHGKQDVEVRLVRVADDKPIVGIRGAVELPDPLQVVELTFALANVGFEKPGEYAVEVCGGKSRAAIGSRKFHVRQMNAATSEGEET